MSIHAKFSYQSPDFTIKQFQCGSFRIDMNRYLNNSVFVGQRALLASNIFVIESKNEVYFLDTAFAELETNPLIQSKLKFHFRDLLSMYSQSKRIYLFISHFHPDHCYGLIDSWEIVESLSIPIFANKKDVDLNYYQDSVLVKFFDENLSHYLFYYDFEVLGNYLSIESGGHSPDHSVLFFNHWNIVYPGDILPTQSHIQNSFQAERNYDEQRFYEIKASLIENMQANHSICLLSHTPNNGIYQF